MPFPSEVFHTIFCYIHVPTLLALRSTNKDLKAIAEDVLSHRTISFKMIDGNSVEGNWFRGIMDVSLQFSAKITSISLKNSFSQAKSFFITVMTNHSNSDDVLGLLKNVSPSYLEFNSMPELQTIDLTTSAFDKLETLTVNCCNKLNSINASCSTIKLVTLHECPNLTKLVMSHGTHYHKMTCYILYTDRIEFV